MCLDLVACTSTTATTTSTTTSTSSDEQSNTTLDIATESIETSLDTRQSISIMLAPSEIATTITATGDMVQYFGEKVDSGTDAHFVLQLETENGAFGEFSMDANTTWYLNYDTGKIETIKGTFTTDNLIFSYSTDLFNLDDVAYICAYIREEGDMPKMNEYLSIRDISMMDEAPQTLVMDEHNVVGIYVDVYNMGVLMIETDTFGYTARLNGTDYDLTTNESDAGDYLAYIGTSDSEEHFCLNILERDENKIISISEYYGEPEMRYTFEYTPIYNAEFYGYENPVKYEFDGINIQITIDDTYTTGWLNFEEVSMGGGSLSMVQLYDQPLTSLKDGDVYFLDLMVFPKTEDLFVEMSIQTFIIYQSYYIEGEYYPNSVILADTLIADVETDHQAQARINDTIGIYVTEEGTPYFEIKENEILLEGETIANIDIEQLYATMISNINMQGSMLLYDGDKPTYVLHLYLDGEYLHIKMQEYGTTSELENNFTLPENFQLPTVDVTVRKQIN